MTLTYFPFSSLMMNFTFTLHSGHLHSPPPLKKGAECILREFADITWLFLYRRLHQGLVCLTLLLKILVQSPPSSRPPLGKLFIGILSQSFRDSLNVAVVLSMFLRKKFSSFSESSESDSSSFYKKMQFNTILNFFSENNEWFHYCYEQPQV